MTLKEVQDWFRREKWKETPDGEFTRAEVKAFFKETRIISNVDDLKNMFDLEPETVMCVECKKDGIELSAPIKRLTLLNDRALQCEYFSLDDNLAFNCMREEELKFQSSKNWDNFKKPKQVKGKMTIDKALTNAGWTTEGIYWDRGTATRISILDRLSNGINFVSYLNGYNFTIPKEIGFWATDITDKGEIRFGDAVVIYNFDDWKKAREEAK